MLALLDTGMQVSECSGVTLVDVYEGYIKVFGKGCKEREVMSEAERSKTQVSCGLSVWMGSLERLLGQDSNL